MLTDEFIKSEMLAEEWIAEIQAVSETLRQGNAAACLAMLEKLEESMQVILALGERDDMNGVSNLIH